jgi:hypothetical protein
MYQMNSQTRIGIDRIGNGTDWQDVLLRTGISHNIQVSASGGSEKNTIHDFRKLSKIKKELLIKTIISGIV